MTSDLAVHRAVELVSRMLREKEQGYGVSAADVNALVDSWDDKKDSLSDLSQEQQVKMQQVMERMRKAEAMAAKLMKLMSSTTSSIIDNFK